MRIVFLSLGLTLVVAAALVTLMERISPTALPAQREALLRIEARLESLEALLKTPPSAGGNSEAGPGRFADPDRLTELRGLIQEVQGQLLDLSREQTRNLERVYAQLLERIEEIAAGANPAGDTAAREALIERLEGLGLKIDLNGKVVQMKGQLADPTRELELLISAPGGRLHESLLMADVLPSALKIAIELIGVPVVEMDAREGFPPEPKGAYIYVSWEGVKKPRRIEDMIWNLEKLDTMPRTPFCFTASYMDTDRNTWERYFVADVQRHLVSLTWNYAVPSLLACPLKEAANEAIWTVNQRYNPPAGTEVQIFIRAEPDEEWDRLP